MTENKIETNGPIFGRNANSNNTPKKPSWFWSIVYKASPFAVIFAMALLEPTVGTALTIWIGFIVIWAIIIPHLNVKFELGIEIWRR